jgi:hypothetical protein
MVMHIVFFRARPGLQATDREALAAAFAEALDAIPAVCGAKVGRRVMHGAGYEREVPGHFDYAAVLEFRDVAGLQAYLAHPMHRELASQIDRCSEAIIAYDYEMQGGGKVDLLVKEADRG